MSPAGRRRVGAARLAALVALPVALMISALPAAAWAGKSSSPAGDIGLSVPGNQSAGDQYVETLPTTKGPRAPGRNRHAKKLSHGIAKKLQKLGGSDAAALKALATSTTLGAPDSGAGSSNDRGKGSNRRGAHEGGSNSGKRHGNSPAVPSAAINAVDRGEAGLGWLVVALLAITALSLGAVGYQRHRDKGSTE